MITEADLAKEGYLPVRQLPDGRWIGIMQMNFTWGLFVGLDEVGYAYRYCYETFGQVIIDLLDWNGQGDPPGKWIVRKGKGGDYHNPRDDL